MDRHGIRAIHRAQVVKLIVKHALKARDLVRDCLRLNCEQRERFARVQMPRHKL